VDTSSFGNILDAIASQPPGPITERFLNAAAIGLDTPGVSVSLAPNSQQLETLCATIFAYDGDILQNDLDEGPSYDAYQFGWPVVCEDFASDHTWPAFSPAATALGLRAMFAFPLQRNAVKLGVLTLSRHTSGALEPQQHSNALIYARLALDLVLAHTFNPTAGFEPRRELTIGANSTLIHQATGMISVQLAIGVTEALALLRANAKTNNHSLGSLADDIVNRRVRLDQEQ